jgi:hypothetical protein
MLEARDAWLFAGSDGMPAHPRTLDHAWTKARIKAGREDVRFHDLRHSRLTWAAATGASTTELMRRAGHASPMAAIRYQHATEDRDRVLADALARMAEPAEVVPLSDGTKDGRSCVWRFGGKCAKPADQLERKAVPTGFEPVSPP